MNNSIVKKLKSNIIVVTIIVTVVFLLMNVALFFINNSFLVNKVKEENQAFLDITTHIINDNDVDVALEYVLHYTHIHNVEIEVLDENGNMLFSSNIAHRYTYQYVIETDQGSYTIFIDNTDSVTVTSFERNTWYVNITLLIVYIVSILVLLYFNRKSASELNKDVDKVLRLIKEETSNLDSFFYLEFEYINNMIRDYLEEIDFLNEQKETSMKGLAHDIKTPLTLVYTYLNKLNKGKEVSAREIEKTYEAAKRINTLVEDIIETSLDQNFKEISLSELLQHKVEEYELFLKQKNIQLESHIDSNVNVYWKEKEVERILDNLISNAFYYSKEDSVVKLSLNKKDITTIEVESSPTNINDIHLSKIFEKGYRGNHQMNQSGKGIGLYISRLLVENAKGKISVEQINENVKFTIVL